MRGHAKTFEELLRAWAAKGRHILVLAQLSLRSTQLLSLRLAYAHVVRTLECISDWTFGCHHRQLSRVFTIDCQTYKVCFACGAKLRYSWRTMSLVRVEMPLTMESFSLLSHKSRTTFGIRRHEA
jgi:hypothetical protein